MQHCYLACVRCLSGGECGPFEIAEEESQVSQDAKALLEAAIAIRLMQNGFLSPLL